MPNAIADRRDAPRYPLILVAEITEIATGNKIVGRTSDVSRTGCYVDTLSPPAKGSEVRVRLVQGGEAFETQGKVMYVSPGLGLGLRFQEGTAEKQMATLDRWLGQAAREL